MEISLLLMEQIVQLFLMILLGYIVVKAGLLKSQDSKVLSVLILYLILPCVIINAFQIELTQDAIQGLLFALVVSVIIQSVLLLLTSMIAKVLHLNEVEMTSVYYSNAGNLIIPIVTYVLGEQWVVYGCVYMCVQLFFMWTHAKQKIAREKGFDWKKIVTNINIISILIGLFFFMTRIQIPSIIQGTMNSVGKMVGPLSMIVTGMIMANMPMQEIFSKPRTYAVTSLRLLGIPLLTVCALWLSHCSMMIPNGKQILLIVYLAVITPSASSITQLCQVYDNDAKYAGAINVMTTLFSIVTMPLMVFLFQLLIQ